MFYIKHRSYFNLVSVILAVIALLGSTPAFAQHGEPQQHAVTQQHTTTQQPPADAHAPAGEAAHHASSGHGETLDVGGLIMGHIGDSHQHHVVGNIAVPLPCIIFDENGGSFFLSSVFDHGHQSHNGYVMDHHGVLMKVQDSSFPKTAEHVEVFARDKKTYVAYNGKEYEASRSGFYDFSITKVVFTMLLTALIMFFLFPRVAAAYRKHQVPKGLQSLIEPIVTFVRDDIAIPNLGDKYMRYMPYLLSVFFFIWINNIIGLIPFFPGGGNVMGNIAVTLTLAVLTFIITTLSGNKAYWGHIFNPPGVPIFVKPILVLIEFLSIFIKPFALMIRLFANIAAGHIIILSLVSIIFIAFVKAGSAGGWGASIISAAFMIFMNVMELLVAALQAYIFTTLSAVFIGQAIEDHHHEDAHH